MSSSQDKSVPEDRPNSGDRRRLVKATKPAAFSDYGEVTCRICPIKKRKAPTEPLLTSTRHRFWLNPVVAASRRWAGQTETGRVA